MCCHNKYTPEYFHKYHTLISKRCKRDDDVPLARLERRPSALMAAADVDVPARVRSNSNAEADDQEAERGCASSDKHNADDRDRRKGAQRRQEAQRIRESQGRERERKEDKERKRERGEEEQEQEQERRRGMDGQKKASRDKGLVADTAQGPDRVDAAPPGTGAGASNSDEHAPQHVWACPLCGKDFSHVHPNARQVCEWMCEWVCICVCWRLLARYWMFVCLMPCRLKSPYAVDTSHFKNIFNAIMIKQEGVHGVAHQVLQKQKV
jgi:hypothetical protein